MIPIKLVIGIIDQANLGFGSIGPRAEQRINEMAITLTNGCMTALKQWLGRDTWHTSHAIDENFFFQFVGRYVSEQGYSLDEQALRETILSIADIGARDDLSETVNERVALMRNILDFMKATGRS